MIILGVINKIKILENNVNNNTKSIKYIELDLDNAIRIKVADVDVDVTAYNPLIKQTDDTPLINASNELVRLGTCALSKDLENEFNLSFGDTIILKGIGSFVFKDRMNSRWKRRVDVFMWDKDKAIQFGIKKTKLYVFDI